MAALKRGIVFLLVCVGWGGGDLSGQGGVEVWRGNAMRQVVPTIQAAVDQARAGDVLRIREGVYHENVRISNKRATATNPIILEAVDGARVVMDGADQALQRPDNGRWTLLEDGAWEATVPWRGRESRALLTWASHADDRLLASHHNEDFFNRTPRGDAIWRVGSRVRLRLVEGGDPNRMALNVGQAEGILQFENSSGWVVRGFELRHAGFAGVHLNGGGVSDIVIENMVIRTAFRGISTEEVGNASQRITIRQCRILNHWNRNWVWTEAYRDSTSSSSEEGAPMRGHGIVFKVKDGELVECEIAGQWDGMFVQGENVRVHRNIIHHIHDDMVELESNFSRNVHFYDNLGFDLFVGISVVANRPGPIYIYRNMMQCLSPVPMATSPTIRNGYPIKFGRDWGPGATGIHFYHNTFVSAGRSAYVSGKNDTDKWSDMNFVNNIFLRPTSGGPPGFEGMGAARNGVRWEGNLFARKGDLARLTQLDPAHAGAGLVADPLLRDPAAAWPDFSLQDDSPARGTGSFYAQNRQWPDSRTHDDGDGKPDIGALPHGSSPWPTGPGGALYQPWLASCE